MAKRNTIGERIVTLKDLKLGISDAQFADALGVARYTVSRWRNEGINPRRGMLPHIAHLLGVSIQDLQSLESDEARMVAETRAPYHAGAKSVPGRSIKSYEQVPGPLTDDLEFVPGDDRDYSLPIAFPSLDDKIIVSLRSDIPGIGLRSLDEIVFESEVPLVLQSMVLARHRGAVRLMLMTGTENGEFRFSPLGPVFSGRSFSLPDAKPFAIAVAVFSKYTNGPNISYNQGRPLHFLLSAPALAALATNRKAPK